METIQLTTATMGKALIRKLVLLVLASSLCSSFTPKPAVNKRLHEVRHQHSLLATQNFIQTPSQEDAVKLGIREWPQQLKQGSWTEQVSAGSTVVRYVLDGNGAVEITQFDESGSTSSITAKVGPGTLVEVDGQSALSWDFGSDEAIILTPGYEEGGKLIGAAATLLILCVALITSFS